MNNGHHHLPPFIPSDSLQEALVAAGFRQSTGSTITHNYSSDHDAVSSSSSSKRIECFDCIDNNDEQCSRMDGNIPCQEEQQRKRHSHDEVEQVRQDDCSWMKPFIPVDVSAPRVHECFMDLCEASMDLDTTINDDASSIGGDSMVGIRDWIVSIRSR